jgi:hypothetical protein
MLARPSTSRAPDPTAPSRAAAPKAAPSAGGGATVDRGPASAESDRIDAFVRAVEAAVADVRLQSLQSPANNDRVYAIALP